MGTSKLNSVKIPVTPKFSSRPLLADMLRQCKSAGGGAECERHGVNRGEGVLQRRALASPNAEHEPRAPGPHPNPRPFLIEPHFAHDFSGVPAHTDRKALPAAHAIRPVDKPRRTDDNLLAGLEQLSGFDLSGVRVHHNSPEPARLNAFAYTHGKDIQLGPGQEKHLAHEGWHVVQQMQGRVKPTIQAGGLLINDDEGLEREADVMGRKAQVLGEKAAAQDFHAATATTEGSVLQDEPFTIASSPLLSAQLVPRQLRQRSTGNVSIIQRATNFVAGSVTRTKNIAAGHIAGDFVNGFTPPTLNGTQILSTAAAQGAIRAPTLAGRSNIDGTTGVFVAAVPTNEASFTMELPSAGPWSTVTPKANVATLFARLGLTAQAPCGTAGNSTFRINGQPTDAGFAANINTHENLHAADHRTGFNSIMVPWDNRLEAARTSGRVFNGANQAAAEAALFAAMGGTPNQIADAQFQEWIRLNNVTHRGTTSATGGPAIPSNSAANPTCATSSMDLT